MGKRSDQAYKRALARAKHSEAMLNKALDSLLSWAYLHRHNLDIAILETKAMKRASEPEAAR